MPGPFHFLPQKSSYSNFTIKIRHEGKRHRCLHNMGLAPNLQVNSTIEHMFLFFFLQNVIFHENSMVLNTQKKSQYHYWYRLLLPGIKFR